MDYSNRKYVIFDVSELNNIDFSQVLETSAETVRRSLDGTKTFVKWENEIPECVESLLTKSSYLTHDEILDELQTSFWSNQTDII